MKKWECDFDRGKEPIQSHLFFKNMSATYIFYYFNESRLMNIYTLEKLEKKSKVGNIFFIHKKVGKCDFDRGKEPIQSHLSWKICPLHIFFYYLSGSS